MSVYPSESDGQTDIADCRSSYPFASAFVGFSSTNLVEKRKSNWKSQAILRKTFQEKALGTGTGKISLLRYGGKGRVVAIGELFGGERFFSIIIFLLRWEWIKLRRAEQEKLNRNKKIYLRWRKMNRSLQRLPKMATAKYSFSDEPVCMLI